MRVSEFLVVIAKLAILLPVAILVGAGVYVACALVGHEVLVWRYGEDLAPIDDTLPMILAVRISVVVSIAGAVFVFAVGCWRFFLRPLRDRRRASDAHSDERDRDPAR